MGGIYKKRFLQNASIAFLLQIVNILTIFFVRTVFIQQLGNDYLALNGLLLNIVSLLSFAELGIGNAIIFSLYEPIAKNNAIKITALMRLFKYVYKWIRIIILLLGVVVIPFIDGLINGIYVIENYKVIFILFLLNTYVSYCFSYKKSLLIADQKNYIVALIHQAMVFLQSIAQYIILLYYQNYIVYLIIHIIVTFLINGMTSLYVDREYNYLKNKTSSLDKREFLQIISNIKNIFFYKIGAIILNSTDNILISYLISTALVGLYSNYSMVINALNSILMQVCNSISATIGNYNVVNSDKQNEEIFRIIFFLSFWVFGVSTICLMTLLNPFILMWLGEDYLLDYRTVIIISLVFYTTGINQIPSQYRTSFGIFRQAKYIPIIASILNLILSIYLGKIIGLNGIFLATIIAKLCTFNLIDPYLIYKKGFKIKSNSFYVTKIKYFVILIISLLCIFYLNSLIIFTNFWGFMFRVIVIFIITNILFFVFLIKDTNLIWLIEEVKKWKKSN